MDFVKPYIKPYKKQLLRLVILLIISMGIQLLFPFTTQAIVDYGIKNKDISFIKLILLGLIALHIGRAVTTIFRHWLALHLGTRVSITIIGEFLAKVIRLPISFFDRDTYGDVSQRVQDHYRIETFITTSLLNLVFSIFSLVVFGIVLCIYSVAIFGLFIAGSILYILYILLFLQRRRELDQDRFKQMSKSQNKLHQIVSGIQDIKLHNYEEKIRSSWEDTQHGIFKINLRKLLLNQYQEVGSVFIFELVNIFILYWAARSVISGEMTLGMMLSVQFTLGQMGAPIHSVIQFIYSLQDARMSGERIVEVDSQQEEDLTSFTDSIPENKTMTFVDVDFKYRQHDRRNVLNNINLSVPENKITAIVGESGSGKTTLLKLLLNFYQPTSGTIYVDRTNLSDLSRKTWRNQCAAVMQDSFIFTDTVANNITLAHQPVDYEKLVYATEQANIHGEIMNLPDGFETVIGNQGLMLSQGQKQRLLIARVIYKDPAIIFFDEATNALDATNEKIIMENLLLLLEKKTVIIIAHRLSTVKNADQIVVLQRGSICEVGTHDQLIEKRGMYYNLVKNQLALERQCDLNPHV